MSKNGEQMIVPIGDVVQSDSQLREVNKESEDYKLMVESLRNGPLINPISVRRQWNKDKNIEELILVDGAHRLAACKEAGFTEIAVNVLNVTELQALAAQIIGNTVKIDQKAYQLGKHYRRMLAVNPALTVAELAKMSCKSESFVRQRIGLDKLNPVIGQYVDDGKIDITTATRLAKLPDDMQKEWAINIMEAANKAEAIEAMETAKRKRDEAERAGRDPNEKPTFEATPKLRNINEFKDELANQTVCQNTDLDGMTPQEAWMAAIKWSVQMDPQSLVAREDKFNANMAAAEARRTEQKSKTKQKKLEKKLEEAEKLKAELGQGQGQAEATTTA